MQVFDQPAGTIPLHALPGVRDRLGGHRGKPQPRQRFDALGRRRFPHPHDPDHQGAQVRLLLALRRQQAQHAETDRQMRRTGRAGLGGVQFQVALVLHLPTGHHLKQMPRRRGFVVGARGHRCVRLLHQQIDAAICRGAHHKVTTLLQTGPQERKHIAGAVAHMDPLCSGGWASDGAHAAFPDEAHSRWTRWARCHLVSPGGAGLRRNGSWCANPSTCRLSGTTASTLWSRKP